MVHDDAGPSLGHDHAVLAHAQELLDAGRTRDARRLVAQFIDSRHLAPRLLPALAAVHVALGRPQAALDAMERALQSLGRSPELLNAHGLLLASLGRVFESCDRLEEALEGDPDNPDLLRNYAFVLHRSGQRARAYSLLEDAYRLFPDSIELRLIAGTIFEFDGRLPQAAVCYREVEDRSSHAGQRRHAAERLAYLRSFDNGGTFAAAMSRESTAVVWPDLPWAGIPSESTDTTASANDYR